MKIIFAGTPEFARVALEQLHHAGHEIALVLSQPDRPAGRGLKLQASPVKQWALEHHLPVLQPAGLRLQGHYAQQAQAAQEVLQQIQADVMVVAAYGLILPQWVLQTPRLGCLNIHASLLPRWRGAAPIHRCIEAGDTHTGVTIMQMDEGLDTGAMLLHEAMPLPERVTTGQLHDQLAAMGARLIVQALESLQQHSLHPQPQPEQGVSYAHKIDKAQAWIDWQRSAQDIDRQVRAFDPFPGAQTSLQGTVLKVWGCEVGDASGASAQASQRVAGQILEVSTQGVHVQCGQGVLRLTSLQRSGGKRLPVADFLRGFELTEGMCWDALPCAVPLTQADQISHTSASGGAT